jgi:hypothetical protein
MYVNGPPQPNPSEPDLWRWMLFVVGENFTIRAQALAKAVNPSLVEGSFHQPDVFIWMPNLGSLGFIQNPSALNLRPFGIRSYYYTSTTGADDEQKRITQNLSELGFSPVVLKKDKRQARTKGVDIALSKDVLSHAFLDNYDVAILVAGDGDYVPLVSELKRLGKIVSVAFFSKFGMSPELRLASDNFYELETAFIAAWKSIQ